MSEPKPTSKQMGDACEMFVAAEITFAGIPAMKVPDNWPCYDVIAQPPGDCAPLRISVKSRTFKAGGDTFVSYNIADAFDWLAIVLMPGGAQTKRRVFLVPKEMATAKARSYSPDSKVAGIREFRLDEVGTKLGQFEDNFSLSPKGTRIASENLPHS